MHAFHIFSPKPYLCKRNKMTNMKFCSGPQDLPIPPCLVSMSKVGVFNCHHQLGNVIIGNIDLILICHHQSEHLNELAQKPAYKSFLSQFTCLTFVASFTSLTSFTWLTSVTQSHPFLIHCRNVLTSPDVFVDYQKSDLIMLLPEKPL